MLVEIENPDWDLDPLRLDDLLPDVEYWEPEECEPLHENGCEYCGNPDTRPYPEPFGNKLCCDQCFSGLIGDGELSDVPWRCGRASYGIDEALWVDRFERREGSGDDEGPARVGHQGSTRA